MTSSATQPLDSCPNNAMPTAVRLTQLAPQLLATSQMAADALPDASSCDSNEEAVTTKWHSLPETVSAGTAFSLPDALPTSPVCPAAVSQQQNPNVLGGICPASATEYLGR